MAKRETLFISASRSDSVVVLMQPAKDDGHKAIALAGELQAVDRRTCFPR